MTPPQEPLFDPAARARAVARARRRQVRGQPFLLERAAADLAERLLDVNRTFSNACLIGPFDWRNAVLARLPEAKRPARFDWREEPGGEGFELVVSLLHLQSVEAVGPWMRGARAMLVPDGLFLACLVGGQSLSELRQALYAVDTEALGAPSPRVHPMIEVRAAAQLLGHAGLAIPVTDSDRFTVRYRDLRTLAGDLRDLGLGNTLAARRTVPMPGLLRALEARMRDGDAPIPVSWELVWMTGWAPHASQQTPLPPGSAKTPLNAALRRIRDGSS